MSNSILKIAALALTIPLCCARAAVADDEAEVADAAAIAPAAGGGTQDTGTYRAYLDKVLTSTTTSVRLFDPASPAVAPITIDSGTAIGSESFGQLFAGTYSGHVISDGYIRAVQYVKNGQLFSASLRKSDPRPPVRISSETKACSVDFVESDFAAPANSGVFYTAKAADNSCTLNKFARLSASGTPVDISAYVEQEAIYNTATAAITGYLLTSNSKVYVANSGLSNLPGVPVLTLTAAGGSSVNSISVPGLGLVYFTAMPNTGGGHTHLYRLKAANNALADLYTFANAAGDNLEIDSGNVYFTDGAKVMRAAHTATSASLVATITGTNTVIRLDGETANRLVVSTRNQNFTSSSVLSVPKTGGGQATLKAPSADFISFGFTAGSNVYINSFSAATHKPAALAIKDDGTGTPQTSPNSLWFFASRGTTADTSGGAMGVLPITRMELIKTTTGSAATGDSVSFFLNDPSTGLGTTPIGTVTGVDSSRSTFVYGYGRYGVGSIGIKRSGKTDLDLYRFDTQTAGSFGSPFHVAAEDENSISH